MYEIFINEFIVKFKRPRFLANKGELINKLCHNFNSVIDSRFLVGKDHIKFGDLKKKTFKLPAFCITYNEEYDGKIISGIDPFHVDPGFPVVYVYCDKLAWFKSESVPRAEEFFLHK